MLVFAIVSLSIMVLTGWAGQVSLGQMGFVADRRARSAPRPRPTGASTSRSTSPLVGLAGALVAVVVGLPALRLRGLYLAVTTLAFALATVSYLLNPQFFGWVPTEPFDPDPLLGIWDYGATTEGMYQLCLVVFVLCVVAVVGIRDSRTGRVLVALRENERGARGLRRVGRAGQAHRLRALRLLRRGRRRRCSCSNGQFTLGLFPAEENLIVFTAAVVGGLGSVLGAVLGALFLKGGQWFLAGRGACSPRRIGVLLVLLLLPGGLGGAFFRVRDLGCAGSRAGEGSSCRACSPTSATGDPSRRTRPCPTWPDRRPAGERTKCRAPAGRRAVPRDPDAPAADVGRALVPAARHRGPPPDAAGSTA